MVFGFGQKIRVVQNSLLKSSCSVYEFEFGNVLTTTHRMLNLNGKTTTTTENN